MDRRVGIQGKSTVRILPLSMGLEDFDKASKFVEIPGCAIVHWYTREMIRTSYCMILTVHVSCEAYPLKGTASRRTPSYLRSIASSPLLRRVQVLFPQTPLVEAGDAREAHYHGGFTLTISSLATRTCCKIRSRLCAGSRLHNGPDCEKRATRLISLSQARPAFSS